MRKTVLVVALVALLAVPAALASPGSQQYEKPKLNNQSPALVSDNGTTAGQAGGAVESAQATPAAVKSSADTLPFTGRSLMVVTAIGIVLILGGLGIGFVGRRRSS